MRFNVFYVVVLSSVFTVMQVFADGQITSISIQDSPTVASSSTTQKSTSTTNQAAPESVVLTVDTKTGSSYQIQAVGKLGQDVWTSLGDTFSGDSTIQTIMLIRRDAFRFFRVVVLKKNETLQEPAGPADSPPAVPATPPTF